MPTTTRRSTPPSTSANGVGDPATLIAIHEAKARLFFVINEFEQSAAEGERILPLARLTGNRLKEAEAHATIAWAAMWSRTRPRSGDSRLARGDSPSPNRWARWPYRRRAHLTIGFVRAVTGVKDESYVEIDKAWRLALPPATASTVRCH